MDNGDFELTPLDQKLFSFLCKEAGKKLSQRETAILLNVSPTAIGKSVKRLEKLKLIKITKLKNINLIELSGEKKAIELKRVENLKQIFLSGLSDFLLKNLPGATIILFGSYSRGEDTSNSDIDIAIIGRKRKALSLEKYEKKLGREVHLLFFDSFNKISRHLKNNILNGIVLFGSV